MIDINIIPLRLVNRNLLEPLIHMHLGSQWHIFIKFLFPLHIMFASPSLIEWFIYTQDIYMPFKSKSFSTHEVWVDGNTFKRSLLISRNFVLKHRVFLLRNWEKMREKQELLKREGERERDASSLSMYTRWGGVIRDDGNIKSGTSLRNSVASNLSYVKNSVR